MNDIAQAIEIALRFTPERQLPGLNGVLFEFVKDGLILYASEGHTVVEISIEQQNGGVSGEFFISSEDLKKYLPKLSGASSIFFSAWGKQLIVTADQDAVIFDSMKFEFEQKYKDFFLETGDDLGVYVDLDLLNESVERCVPVIASFKNSGPAVRMKNNSTTLIVEPGLIKQSTITSINIVIAEMKFL